MEKQCRTINTALSIPKTFVIIIILEYLLKRFCFLYRLLVGAPLGKNLQPNTTKSGALWKCPLDPQTGDCEQIITDGRRSESTALYFITKISTHYIIYKHVCLTILCIWSSFMPSRLQSWKS